MNKYNQKGAAILELSLVLPIIFLMMISGIDIVRYLQTKTNLDKSTELALMKAQRLVFLDMNPRGITTNEQKEIYKKSFQNALETGNFYSKHALSGVSKSTNESFHKASHIIPFSSSVGGDQLLENDNVAILFPCTKVTFTRSDGSTYEEAHPIQDTTPGSGCNTSDDSELNDDYRIALRGAELIAIARTDFEFMSPVFNVAGIRSVASKAFGRREIPQVGLAQSSLSGATYTFPTIDSIEVIGPETEGSDPDDTSTDGDALGLLSGDIGSQTGIDISTGSTGSDGSSGGSFSTAG